ERKGGVIRARRSAMKPVAPAAQPACAEAPAGGAVQGGASLYLLRPYLGSNTALQTTTTVTDTAGVKEEARPHAGKPTPPSRTGRARWRASGSAVSGSAGEGTTLIGATVPLVEPFSCPPSSCPGHYPRRLATTGTLLPWALLPGRNLVVAPLIWSTF